MMKQLLYLVAFGWAGIAAAQGHDEHLVGTRTWKAPPLPMEKNEVVYKGEVRLPGVKQDKLYQNAYDWFKYNMKSDDVSIKVADKKQGYIAGKGKIMYNQSVLMNNAAQGIYFDYDVWVNNGEYKYRVSNIEAIVPGNSFYYTDMYLEDTRSGPPDQKWDAKYRYEMLSDMHSFMTLMIGGFQKQMLRK